MASLRSPQAALGFSGKYPANTHRDLKRRLPQPVLAPGLYRMPCRAASTTLQGAFQYATLHMLCPSKGSCSKPFTQLRAVLQTCALLRWPHELFSAVYKHFPKEWIARIRGVADLGDFWRRVAGAPQMASHPLLRDQHCALDKTIPFSLHGDGVPIVGAGKSYQQSADIYSFCSLVAQGSTKETNFIVAMLFARSQASGGHTTRAFWRKLTWSLTALFNGAGR